MSEGTHWILREPKQLDLNVSQQVKTYQTNPALKILLTSFPVILYENTRRTICIFGISVSAMELRKQHNEFLVGFIALWVIHFNGNLLLHPQWYILVHLGDKTYWTQKEPSSQLML